MKKLLYLSFILLLMTSCKLKKNLSIYEYGTPTKEKITLVPTGQQIPNDYVLVGTCTYGESGFTPTEICTYEAITRTAMEDAHNIGATIVYVTKVKEPSFGSSCYNITVHFYKKKE